MEGKLGGTGRMVILPVDQGFEHGPARSFAPNPAAYDPRYHFELAIEAGLNAYAAPLGMIEAGAATYAGAIPTILKVNSSNSLSTTKDQAVTGTVDDALRLGCSAIGFTIYPGLRIPVRDDGGAARAGRGGEGRRPRRGGLELPARPDARQGRRDRARHLRLCRAHGGADRRAHHQGEAADRGDQPGCGEEDLREVPGPRSTTRRRASRHVVQACFGGRRLVVFSGGEAKGDRGIMEEVRAIHAGGGNGSIIGRNAFQRPKARR